SNYSSSVTFPTSNSTVSSSITLRTVPTSKTTSTTTITQPPTTQVTTSSHTMSSTISSTSSTSTTYTTTSSYASVVSTIGTIPLMSIGTGVGCCVYSTYDSPNTTIYATAGRDGGLWLFKNGSQIATLSTNNYSLSMVKSISSNSENGYVYVLNQATGNDVCCTVWITEVSGQGFVGPPVYEWGVTSNLLFDPQNGYAYFGTGGGGSCASNPNGLQVVESSNISQNVKFISIGQQPPENNVCSPHSPFTPVSLALDSNGQVYAATQGSNTTFYVASGLNLLPSNFTVSGKNVGLVYNPTNGYLYSEQLVNQTQDRDGNAIRGYYDVFMINTATNTVINGTIIPGEAHLVYNSADHNVYAFGQDQITVISGTTITGTYPEPTSASVLSVVYDESNNEFVSFDSGSSLVSTTTTTNSTTSSTQSPPGTIATIPGALGNSYAYDPSNQAIYAVAANFSGIEEINGSTNSLVGNIRFSCGNPLSVTFDTRDNILYALYNSDPNNCTDSNTTLVGIDPTTNTIISDSSALGFTGTMSYDSRDNTLFIEGRNSTMVPVMWVVNASNGALAGQMSAPVGFYPFIWGPMLYDPVNGLLYYEWSTPGANNNYYQGTIVNASNYTIVGTFDPYSGDMPPSAMTYDPATGLVYVAEQGSGGCLGYNTCFFDGGKNVTVIDGAEVTGEIPVSSNENSTLTSIAYAQGSIYVVNGTSSSSSESLTLINSSVISSEQLTFSATALYTDQANPSWLYVFGPSAVYVIKVN
ncbi:MAG: hypothetical protein JRN15_23225, partial [Nitrososphaerota archaeon]|nr:hypothetical protein [Nitrososphaerota archaeon]